MQHFTITNELDVLDLKREEGYFIYIWHRKDEILYVGSTLCLRDRLSGHSIIWKNFQENDVIFGYSLNCKTEAELRKIESLIIAEHEPKYNIRSNKTAWEKKKKENKDFREKVNSGEIKLKAVIKVISEDELYKTMSCEAKEKRAKQLRTMAMSRKYKMGKYSPLITCGTIKD